MPVQHISLGGYQFPLAENEERPFRRAGLSKMLQRTEVTGVPGAQNLDTMAWPWSTSDFSNGEGSLVFNPRVTDNLGYPFPSFKQTDGAIDVRTRGEFKMAPVSSLVTATGGATTTTTQGSAMTTNSGAPVIGPYFPTVESRTTSLQGAATTTHIVSLPSGIQANDLLVMFFSQGSTGTPFTHTGWSILSSGSITSDGGAKLFLLYRYADGTEGTTQTVTTSGSTKSAHVVLRISGAENPATQAPEQGVDVDGTSTSPNPPSLSPTGGAKNYLWLAANVAEDGSLSTVAPTSYTNLQTLNSGGTSSTDIAVGTAERQVNGSSEDPGAFTLTTSKDWSANTYVIHPASTGSNSRLDAVEGVRVASTPGASSVTVTARFLGYLTTTDTATIKLRIFNNTDTAAVSDTTLAITAPESGTAHDLQLVFTATAAKEYHYIAELSAASGLGATDYVEVDYSTETVAATPSDVRIVQMGYNEEIVALAWDGTNIDVYIWDFTNNEWDQQTNNAVASLPICMASSDRFNYVLCADKKIYQWTTGAFTEYTAANPSTLPVAIAVSANRLYMVGQGATRYLHEITLDGAGGYTENTADYKRVGSGDFPGEVTHDTTLRQYMCATDNGVRFICNALGGPTQIYDYSDGTLKPIAKLNEGYRAHSIYHYGGTTYIGTQFSNRAVTPAKTRGGAYYIPSDGVLRPLGIFRFHDPDDERVCYINAYDNAVLFLQGRYLWRYDTTTGGITLDTLFGPGTDSNARTFAVMDTKKWACYSGEGVHVTGNSYPVAQSVYQYSGVWDWDAPANDKTLIDITVVTKPLPANTSVSIEYQDDEDGTWTMLPALASASTTGETTHVFKAWGSAASPSTVSFRNLQWRVGLRSSDGVSTNTVRSVTPRAYVLEYQEVFDIAIRLHDEDSDNHPYADQYFGKDRAELLQDLIDDKAIVSFVNNYESAEERPDPETKAVVIEDPFRDLAKQGQGTARLRLVVVG